VSDKDSEHPNLSFSPRAQSSQNRSSGSKDSDEKRKVSQRSQYVPLKSESPFVLPGASADKGRGSPVYRRCEDEPIHTPGAIQSFGALLGLNYTDSGNLEVRIASENSRKVLGYGPEQLFKLHSFLDILGKDVRQEMVAHVRNALDNGSAMQEETRLDVFQMIISFPYEPDLHLWCAIHPAPTQQGLIICEFEAYSDAFYLKDVGVTKAPPVRPIGLMDFDVSPEEFKKSITSASKPLPVIEMAHQKQNKHFSSLDLFNAMSQAQQQISAATTLQTLLEVVVGIISELTGFHRVMFYRFDSQKNGCVEAELVNPQACTDIFRGKFRYDTWKFHH
jgi:light-regulated signal transduction histidine kinase (bacteriophytochrome)